MNAIPPSFPGFGPGFDDAAIRAQAADKTGLRWAALTEAGALVASLAGAEPDPEIAEEPDVPALIRSAKGWRREHAENGVADLVAIMEPGIAALLAINARGTDPRAAAQALWREFRAARAALLALVRVYP